MISGLRVEKVNTFQGHNNAVYSLALSGNDTFFSGGADKLVAEWDFQNPGEGTLLAKIPETIYSLHTDFINNRLLVGQATGGIHYIDLADRVERRLLQYHTTPVFHIGESVKHHLFFSLSGDGKLGIIESENLSLQGILEISTGKLRTCAVNSDETLLAIGSADGIITVLSLPDLKPVKRWQAHQVDFSVNALTFTGDNKKLLSGSRDAHMNIYDVEGDFSLIQSIPAHNYAIYSIVFSPDNKFLATGSRDKTIKLWDPVSFEVLQRIDLEKNEGHKNSVNKIIWHPQTGYLISAGDDRAIMAWKISAAYQANGTHHLN